MNRRSPWIGAFLAAILLSSLAPTLRAQNAQVEWLRVETNDDVKVEVEHRSLKIEKDGLIRANFKTTLFSEQLIPGSKVNKFVVRLDSIEFDWRKRQYRVVESSYLDRQGKEISRSAVGDWSRMAGITAAKFFHAAEQLPPFGTWRVLSYRYVSGERLSNNEPTELTSLINKFMFISLTDVQIGNGRCTSPLYELATITDQDWVKRIGFSLSSAGISSDKADSISLKCEKSDNFPAQAVILRLSDYKALILWEGVLFEIERPGNPFSP